MKNQKLNFLPKSLNEKILVQELGKETLIYKADTGKAFCLNETSALVWQECDGKKSVEEIAGNVSRKLAKTVSPDFIWLALDQLKKENLLDNDEFDLPAFTGFTRREAVKKIGLASMIALPVITALASPLAVQAGSCVAVCQVEEDCLTAGNGFGCINGCCFPTT